MNCFLNVQQAFAFLASITKMSRYENTWTLKTEWDKTSGSQQWLCRILLAMWSAFLESHLYRERTGRAIQTAGFAWGRWRRRRENEVLMRNVIITIEEMRRRITTLGRIPQYVIPGPSFDAEHSLTCKIIHTPAQAAAIGHAKTIRTTIQRIAKIGLRAIVVY